MRTHLLALTIALGVTASASAEPRVGQPVPSFTVDDIAGTTHTQRDLTGRWSVLLTMTDKDTGPSLTAWYRRLERTVPPGARLLTFCAVSLFPLIPTATVVSQARDATPRSRWSEVWLSRNGSLAESLGLPESETPWIFVVDPSGRVVESVHATADDAGVARVLAALNRPRPSAPPATR